MNIYLVDSWIDKPAIIEAFNTEHAKNIYANQLGYVNSSEMLNRLGFKFGVVNVEEIRADGNQDCEPRYSQVRTH